MSDPEPEWLTLEEWRAGMEYHPNRRLAAFLLNLVVNWHCEVDKSAGQAVFLYCSCAQAHMQGIETFPTARVDFPEHMMHKVRSTFSCCFKGG